ncbi:MAG: endopeptidase La [Bacteroidota bacterium]
MFKSNPTKKLAHGTKDEESEMFPFFSLDDAEDDQTQADDLPEELPVLALKNTVLFPSIIIPITIGRKKSIRAVNDAWNSHKYVAVFSQRDTDVEEPQPEDLFQIGTVARIMKILKMPDGSLTAILRGRQRVNMSAMTATDPVLVANITPRPQVMPPDDDDTFKAVIESISDHAQRAVELSPQIPSEAAFMLSNIESPPYLLNFIGSNLNLPVEDKQSLLEIDSLIEKATQILEKVQKELHILELRDQIENKTRGDIEKQQRDYFLNQQLKTIQDELGQSPHEEEIAKLEQRAKGKDWPKVVEDTFGREIARLRRMNPQVAEFSVQLSYLEMLLDLPWNETTPDNFDLNHAEKVLDDDHYGLEKVKERIISHLAVLKLKGDLRAPILLLLGPPGVGKTSLGRSVAKALGREYVRISLGGLHDESEIRGHRKTYIGAMPGRIVQSLKKAKTSNPVFVLDEVDKIGQSHRGDPSSALLEVLDPEQNTSFHDNYIDLDIDLSRVLFIATANDISSIQPALRDRMEIIRIAGYSVEEKLQIAKRHLIAKQRKEHGLKANQVKIPVKTLKALIQGYTRESGVRSLDRRIASIMRHVAKEIAYERADSLSVQAEELADILGPKLFVGNGFETIDRPGVGVGLAWTPVGGDILFVECSTSPGKGKLVQTGNLGNVMKESAVTALSYIKSHAEKLGIDPKKFNETDIHLHVPEGATPKDGPSAGVTMLSVLASAFTGRRLKSKLAMTGEITLRGKVLPVGGIKEKLLAARRAGMKNVILCEANKRHVAEIEPDYLKGLHIHYVGRMEEVLELALR